MPIHEKIDYVEFPARDIDSSKAFFIEVFGWSFTDYGRRYSAFTNSGLDGGFFDSQQMPIKKANAGTLVVFYSDHLEATQEKIERAGGKIIKQIFSFPGGRRFHFIEPSGNELAVWSDK